MSNDDSVKLLFFANLREDLGSAGEDLALPQGVGTVGALRSHLAGRGGVWQAAFSGTKLSVAVNQELVRADAVIRAGDEIAFFPPVTGG